MSDKPLFQKSDEEEARYASERVPGSGPSERSGDPDTGLIPGAIAPTVGGTLTPATGNVFAPIAGGAALDDLINDETPRSDDESHE